MATLSWARPSTAPPPDGPFTVMASRFELRRPRDVPAFLAAALRIRRHMIAADVAGLSLIAEPLRR